LSAAAALAVGAVVSVAATAEPVARRHGCRAPGAHVVLQNRVARVDRTGKRGLFRFSYCYLADGRRHFLTSESLFASVEQVQINATQGAWLERTCKEGSCRDDVAFRRLRPTPGLAIFYPTQGEVAELLLGAKRTAAWTARKTTDGVKSTAVIKLDAAGLTVLDEAPTIPARSLGLSSDRRTVYWKNDSQTKSAPLTPG
jgi:hypothetical protein